MSEERYTCDHCGAELFAEEVHERINCDNPRYPVFLTLCNDCDQDYEVWNSEDEEKQR